jgi:hypothetical protein
LLDTVKKFSWNLNLGLQRLLSFQLLLEILLILVLASLCPAKTTTQFRVSSKIHFVFVFGETRNKTVSLFHRNELAVSLNFALKGKKQFCETKQTILQVSNEFFSSRLSFIVSSFQENRYASMLS